MLTNKNKHSFPGTWKRHYRVSYITIICLIAATLWSCDSVGDFGGMNTNPNQPTQIRPSLQFTNILVASSYSSSTLSRANWMLSGPVIQSVTRPNSSYNFYRHNQAWSSDFFSENYGDKIRNINDLLNSLQTMKENSEQVDNKIAATRIMRIYLFHRVTDLYGDIPYFNAGKATETGNYSPKYDPQSEIYPDMLNELEEAVNQFDESQPMFTGADLIYGGDITKWRKFGNSLRLRLALRLVEVDEAMAQSEALAALDAPGGVMTSNNDIAYYNKMDRTGNPFANGNSLALENDGLAYLTHTMVQWLKNRNDPRLSIYGAIMNTDNSTISAAPGHVVSTDPADQLGFPSGYGTSASGGSPDIANHSTYSTAKAQTPTPEQPINAYSKVNPVLWKYNAPYIFQTYAEVELMRAEVAARGWSSEVAANHYNAGVRAAMEHLAMYDGGTGTTITDAQINEYLTENSYDPTNAIEQINEQYWVATFMDFIEGWANFRRSGYPDLEPAKVDSPEWPQGSSTNEEWPRRLLYPLSEKDENTQNYDEAMSRQGLQGADSDIAIPVWWDAN